MREPTQYQTLIAKLPARIVRRLREYVHSAASPYDGVNEFLAVAIENQLNLEHDEMPVQISTGEVWQALPAYLFRNIVASDLAENLQAPMDALVVRPNGGDVLLRPASMTRQTMAPASTGRPLPGMTNRLTPFVIAARVLVNMTVDSGRFPDLPEYVQTASKLARDVGQNLRHQDRQLGLRGIQRRWISFPVGDDPKKSLSRFRTSFLINRPGVRGQGPLAEIGLAAWEAGVVGPTDRCVELAMAPSLILDGDTKSDRTLHPKQQSILRDAIREIPGERAAVREFFNVVEMTGGHQHRVDQELAVRSGGAMSTQVKVHRAAMVGRLRDLGDLEIEEEEVGPLIRMTDSGMSFSEELNRG
jgi:hypothetical protein